MRVTGMGRTELVERLEFATSQLATVRDEKARVEGELRLAYDNLTATQERCTALEIEVRALRRLRHDDATDPLLAGALACLSHGVAIARGKHPKGPSLRSLMEEIGEVASAVRRESPDRVRDELLDVAVVAIRIWLGDSKFITRERAWNAPGQQEEETRGNDNA